MCVGLIEALVLPGIQQSNPVTRMAAVKALSMMCMLDKQEAQRRLHILLLLLETDQEPIQLVVLQGLFDLALLFELEDPSALEGEAACASRDCLLAKLLHFLNHADSELQTVAVEGATKLLFLKKLGGVMAQETLTQLLLLHFNPAVVELERLQQCLAAFFPLYAYSWLPHQVMLARILVPTLQILVKAPRSSPLAQTQPLKVAQFIVVLCDSRNSDVPSVCGLDNPHVIIAQALGQSTAEIGPKTVSRVLLALHLDLVKNQRGVRMLRGVVEQVLGVLCDKPIEKKLMQFAEMLQAADVTPADDPLALESRPTAPEQDDLGEVDAAEEADVADGDEGSRHGRRLKQKNQVVLWTPQAGGKRKPPPSPADLKEAERRKEVSKRRQKGQKQQSRTETITPAADEEEAAYEAEPESLSEDEAAEETAQLPAPPESPKEAATPQKVSGTQCNKAKAAASKRKPPPSPADLKEAERRKVSKRRQKGQKQQSRTETITPAADEEEAVEETQSWRSKSKNAVVRSGEVHCTECNAKMQQVDCVKYRGGYKCEDQGKCTPRKRGSSEGRSMRSRQK